jgi:cation-transporting ATPase I
MDAVAHDIEAALSIVEGVHWAEVDATLARVAIDFDAGDVDVDDLVDVVQQVEDAHGIGAHDRPADRPDHPADLDPVLWEAIELGADVLGIGVSALAGIVRLPLVPIELASVLPALDAVPPVRELLDRRKGLEAAMVSAAAMLQGFANGPVALAVDAAHRTSLLAEAALRRAAWERFAARAFREPAEARSIAIPTDPRPLPLPNGTIETYAQTVSLASIGAGGVAFALTRDARRAADVMLAAVPRAARLGREGFATQAGRVFATRDIVVMDPRVLRRLDRIDTVVVDAALLGTDDAARTLREAVRAAAQDLVIAGERDDATPDADLVVDGGPQLATSVRALQADGRVVAVVAARSEAALAAADCGIGVVAAIDDGRRAPWGAHVLCPTLDDAALIVDATASARVASTHAVRIATAGSAIAAGFAVMPGAARRGLLAAHSASLVAMAAGTWTAASLARRPRPGPGADQVPWHALPVDEVTTRLETSAAGLHENDAVARRVDDLTDSTPSFGRLLLSELSNPLTALLAAGGALSTVAGSVTDGLLITSVLGLNAVVGAGQRRRTEDAIHRLHAAVSSESARVRRDGTDQRVPPTDVVPGDLVVLQAGDIVPADARVVSASSVEVDESALTGESLPVAKDADPVAEPTPVAERMSMLYEGTAIVAGRAEGAVVAVGADTEARRGAVGAHAPVTGVEARLESLTRRTVPIVLAAGATLTGTTLLRGAALREAVATGVSLTAAAVPEGLPFLATVAQSGAAQRLSSRGVLVRNPRVLEALGRVDVLCFDKTGTLTEGKLQLRSVSDGEIVEAMPDIDGRRRLVLAAALRATPRARGPERMAHSTDQAIVDGAAEVAVATELGAPEWRRRTTLPFASNRGYHAALGRGRGGDRLAVKGAPEAVLPRCDAWRRAGNVVALDRRTRARLERHVDDLAGRGLRVLAVAERAASDRSDIDDERVERLELLGFVTVADVARKTAIHPIDRLHKAGITVAMVTGDHPGTAEAISSQLGLLNGGRVMAGREIDALDDERLDAAVDGVTVFARVTPAHKVRIVQAYQRRGLVVAMAGDGSNDAQAIRLADVGIAFGPRATSAARAAADLVIVDDEVDTLLEAMVEGRAMWASVRDALGLLLGGNLGETVFTTGATLLTGRSPLNARQLLAVNLLTDLAPAMAIAVQPPLSHAVDLRREGPETSLGGRLMRDIVVRAVATSGGAALAWIAARGTGTPARASTVALCALVGAQLGQTIVLGHHSPLVLMSSAVSVAALAAIVQTPGVSRFFGCRPLGPVGWAIATGAATTATLGAAAAGAVLARRDARDDHAVELTDAHVATEPRRPGGVVPLRVATA